MKNMLDNKKNKPQVREPYEPVRVEVTKVTSQGILCASARSGPAMLQTYKRF